jgi:activator of HSP90 ATPase
MTTYGDERVTDYGLEKMRPDMRNVNEWHWTEKDLTALSKAKLSELLIGVQASDDIGNTAKIEKVKKIDGDAYCNTRKGKRILGYDLVVQMHV